MNRIKVRLKKLVLSSKPSYMSLIKVKRIVLVIKLSLKTYK